MMERVRLLAATFILLMLWTVNAAFADADRSSAPHWYTETDADTRTYADYYFSRDVAVRIYGKPEFTFEYPERPTMMVKLGNTELPMLFDTGTYTSILRLGVDDPLPAGMHLVGDSNTPAWLEHKSLTDGTVTLSYAILDCISLGDVYLRDVPFRIYRDATFDERDYAGAIAPVLFQDYIIEVDNSTLTIRLHDRSEYIPPAEALMLPIMMLPRGLFIPLKLGDEQLWFHFDTGYSGTLGLLEKAIARHDAIVTESSNIHEYSGWRENRSYSTIYTYITIESYSYLNWAANEAVSISVCADVYDERYQELGNYNIGGIVGTRLLSALFESYCIDMRQGRIYLQ